MYFVSSLKTFPFSRDGFIHAPAAVQTPVAAFGPRPHAIVASVTLTMGELSWTVRTQFPAWSSVPTQNSCHVAWAEAVETAARIARTTCIFTIEGFDKPR